MSELAFSENAEIMLERVMLIAELLTRQSRPIQQYQIDEEQPLDEKTQADESVVE
jgi:hypothetical protein